MTENKDLEFLEIADEVVAIIAGLAATEVDGVAGMSGGIAGGFAEILGRKNLTKGVKVDLNEDQSKIDIFVIVDYGISIPEVAKNIKTNVKQAIENMTGISPDGIYIHVQGVEFLEEEEKKEDETE